MLSDATRTTGTSRWCDVSKPSRTAKGVSAKSVEPAAKRKVVVFSSLIVVLTLTSALLLALEPDKLRPDPGSRLAAVDTHDAMEAIFQTRVPAVANRWKYIYIRHSATKAGSAITISQQPGGLGDHFVIGNGDGSIDGEIQISERWTEQVAPTPPPGALNIDPQAISICLIGDFHQNLPTPLQMQRLNKLVATLQSRFQISARDVQMVTDNTGNRAVEIGRYFPVSAFRGQLVK